MWNEGMIGSLGRRAKSVALAATAAIAALLVGPASASAQQVRTFPGSSCQATGSAQDLYYGSSGLLIANRGSSQNSAVCPIVRENGLAPWSTVVVVVRDRHSTADITCVARAGDLTGTAGLGWSETQSSVGEGIQAIVFGPPSSDVPLYGPYTIVCSIPAMEETNQPSYIASYLVVEP